MRKPLMSRSRMRSAINDVYTSAIAVFQQQMLQLHPPPRNGIETISSPKVLYSCDSYGMNQPEYGTTRAPNLWPSSTEARISSRFNTLHVPDLSLTRACFKLVCISGVGMIGQPCSGKNQISPLFMWL